MKIKINGIKMSLSAFIIAAIMMFFLDSIAVWVVSKLIAFVFGIGFCLGFGKCMAIIGIIYLLRMIIMRSGSETEVMEDE